LGAPFQRRRGRKRKRSFFLVRKGAIGMLGGLGEEGLQMGGFCEKEDFRSGT